MGLKQSIVIKSEYTNNARSKAGKGSRGASPGQYVMRYMAREEATEVLLPAGYDAMAFTRYMTRADATEALKERQDEAGDADGYGSPLVVKHRFRQREKLSGRAFGTNGLSLSHEALEASSATIQQAFDAGHSVQKIILSFTEDYLKETGVLDPDFRHKGRGSYKGQLDQFKLRTAIMAGVDQMTKVGRFAAPHWVGTIQFDTSHVHAHLAVVDTDFAPSRMKSDGADKGKINEAEKKACRKGIHHSLMDMTALHRFNGQASTERQNVAAHVTDYAYTAIADNARVQLLLAALPEDKTEWRFKTNRTSMKHANALATDIVEAVFHEDPVGSGYEAAMEAVRAYAMSSRQLNQLDDEEEETLVQTGYQRLLERSVNGLYGALKRIDDAERVAPTLMTDIQSASDAELAERLAMPDPEAADAMAFTLRLRGYQEREAVHVAEATVFHDLVTEFETADARGVVDPSARVMRDFYLSEQTYHMGVADKYRRFLTFDHPADVRAVAEHQPTHDALVLRHGSLTEADADTYRQDVKAYTFACFKDGVASLKEWEAISGEDPVARRPVLPLPPRPRVDNLTDAHFQTVKALDVHHLGLDFAGREAVIDEPNALRFAAAYAERDYHATRAEAYVQSTNQRLPALERARADIDEMKRAVDLAIETGHIASVTFDAATSPRGRRTIPVDKNVEVRRHVAEALEHVTDLDQEELG